MTRQLPGWVPAAVVLVVFGLLGQYMGAEARPLFLVACGAAGWYAWGQGPGPHVQATLLFFLFTPLIRRLVDLSAGYDNLSLMILGPLVALLPACGRAFELLGTLRGASRMAPLLVVAACVFYAALLTLCYGDWVSLGREGIKWAVPMAYAIALVDKSDPDDILEHAANVFAFALPIVGLYGIAQYVDPPDWDRFWMQSTTILSIGLPLPYEVRVFGTMNGPASFATFISIGLLLVWLQKKKWFWQIFLIPAVVALFLTLYRTAWTSAFAAMLFCSIFSSTKARIIPLFVGIVVATVAVVMFTPFGDVITERLATFLDGSQDGSARERIEEFSILWTAPDSYLFGVGFTTLDIGVAGTLAIDGMIVTCWYSMGIIVGLCCLAAVIWASATSIILAFNDRGATSVLLGAFGFYFLAQLPLATIANGEAGYLFWTFFALALNSRKNEFLLSQPRRLGGVAA
jgi:hypothetical protein